MDFMTRFLPTLLLLLGLTPAASAHPLDDNWYDRTVTVRLTPSGVVVRYSLNMTWFALNADWARNLSPAEIAKVDKSERGLAAACARPLGAEVTGKLRATANDRPLAFRVERVAIRPAARVEYEFTLRAGWPPGGRKRSFALVDETFPDKTRFLTLTLGDPADGVKIES